MEEWPSLEMAADCKSVGAAYTGSNPVSSTKVTTRLNSGVKHVAVRIRIKLDKRNLHNMVPSTNRQGHQPFTLAMLGSNPAGITRWGRSSDGRAPALQAGGRGSDPLRFHQMAPSSNRRGRKPLKLVMLSSSLTGVTKNHFLTKLRRLSSNSLQPPPMAH